MSNLRPNDVRQLNALALAYMGDAVLELHIRNYLLQSGRVKPNTLHREATRYVSAKAQSNAMHELLETDFLSEEEIAVFKRGRNAKSGSVPKNTDVRTYNNSSGYEALIGSLYLRDEHERVAELIKRTIEICEQYKEEK